MIRILLRAYQLVLSPLLGPGCRFHPTCSHYAMEAFDRFGFWSATRRTLVRLAKCHPFHPGGYDPVLGGSRTLSPNPSLGLAAGLTFRRVNPTANLGSGSIPTVASAPVDRPARRAVPVARAARSGTAKRQPPASRAPRASAGPAAILLFPVKEHP